MLFHTSQESESYLFQTLTCSFPNRVDHAHRHKVNSFLHCLTLLVINILFSIFQQQVMIDEADVNEAIAGPQQKKVRPMSPRDIGRIRRKRLDSPILGKRSPGTVVSPPPTPPPTSPQQANKLPAQNKTVQQLAGKNKQSCPVRRK